MCILSQLTKQTELIMSWKAFPPSLSHIPFYNLRKVPGSLSSPAFALVLLTCKLPPPTPSSHPFLLLPWLSAKVSYHVTLLGKKKTLFLTIQIKIILPSFDALAYLLLLPTKSVKYTFWDNHFLQPIFS